MTVVFLLEGKGKSKKPKPLRVKAQQREQRSAERTKRSLCVYKCFYVLLLLSTKEVLYRVVVTPCPSRQQRGAWLWQEGVLNSISVPPRGSLRLFCCHIHHLFQLISACTAGEMFQSLKELVSLSSPDSSHRLQTSISTLLGLSVEWFAVCQKVEREPGS